MNLRPIEGDNIGPPSSDPVRTGFHQIEVIILQYMCKRQLHCNAGIEAPGTYNAADAPIVIVRREVSEFRWSFGLQCFSDSGWYMCRFGYKAESVELQGVRKVLIIMKNGFGRYGCPASLLDFGAI